MNEKYSQRHLPEAQATANTGTELATSVSTLRASNDSPKSEGASRVADSPDAEQLANLRAKLNSIPEIREDRVATVSAAIRKGTFSVSNKQIAQAFLRDFQMGIRSGDS